jgi:hypothetical protein
LNFRTNGISTASVAIVTIGILIVGIATSLTILGVVHQNGAIVTEHPTQVSGSTSLSTTTNPSSSYSSSSLSSLSLESSSSGNGYLIMFSCVSGCYQGLPNPNPNATSVVGNNWSMAWVVMFASKNTGFAYDPDANIPSGWSNPYPWYANEPLGVYSSTPQILVNSTFFYTANNFEAGKYGFGSPQQNLTLSASVYQVPGNSSTTFWAFGYNPNMVSLVQGMKAIQTSTIVIFPNSNDETSCPLLVPSNVTQFCGEA